VETAKHLRLTARWNVEARRIQTAYRLYAARHKAARIRHHYYERMKARRELVLDTFESWAARSKAAQIGLLRPFAPSGLHPNTTMSARDVPVMPNGIRIAPMLVKVYREWMYSRGHRRELSKMIKQRRAFLRKAFLEVTDAPTLRYRRFTPKRKLMQDLATVVGTNLRAVGLAKRELPAKVLSQRNNKLMPNTSKLTKRTWSALHAFKQFVKSPHVRVKGQFLYHGEWERQGRVLSFSKRRLIPHGEGLLEFPIGYGYAPDECTLKVGVLRGTRLLAIGSDGKSSDPYAQVKCAGYKYKTKFREKTLEPVWDEHFEIPVSDPAAYLKIEVCAIGLPRCSQIQSAPNHAIRHITSGHGAARRSAACTEYTRNSTHRNAPHRTALHTGI